MQYGQRISFSDTQVTHFADLANIGWSLDKVMEISKTLYPKIRIGISLRMDCLAIYESPKPKSTS
jgi:hypothetical protein